MSVTTIDDLRPDPHNANKGTPRGHGMIEHSIRAHGAGRSGVAAQDGTMIAGSQTLEEMATLGIPVRTVHTTGDEWVVVVRDDLVAGSEAAVALALADNRATEIGLDWDWPILSGIDDTMPNALDGLFDPTEIDLYLRAMTDAPVGGEDGIGGAGGDEFADVPDVAIPVLAALGDLWACGPHQVWCGDCTNLDPWPTAWREDQGTLGGVMTSPPYAEQRVGYYASVPVAAYPDWWMGVADMVHRVIGPTGSFLLNIKPNVVDGALSPYVMRLVLAMSDPPEGSLHGRWVLKDEFAWTRQGMPGDAKHMNRFKNAWESVYWFSKSKRPALYPDAVRHVSKAVPLDDHWQRPMDEWQGSGRNDALGAGRKIGAGLAYPSNVISFATYDKATGHNAAWPVTLPQFFLQACSVPGSVWWDPFGGSGTLMIAAHRTGRIARLTELDPRSVDRMLYRWTLETGQDPVRLIAGEG